MAFVAQVNQPVTRRVGYYVYNVVPIYFIIVGFGFFTFGNEIDDWGNRLNAQIALLLTATAFKYSYKDVLPRVHSGVRRRARAQL